MTVGDYIEALYRRLQVAGLCYGHGTDNAYDEACYLVLGTLRLDPDSFDDALGRTISSDEQALLEAHATRRIDECVPVAYLVGEAWFAGLRFLSDERALVPRSPIGELILNHFEPLLRVSPARILDLCCGNGCIGIACALAFPDASVELADLSVDALALARDNIALHDLDGRVTTIASDCFDTLQGPYDLIVCNPPYVGREEFDGLPAEFGHEPGSGLLCADEGLAIPLRILSRAGDYLAARGVLIMEVGFSDHLLNARLPDVPFLWLEFEHGGQGVFMLTREQLLAYRERFSAAGG